MVCKTKKRREGCIHWGAGRDPGPADGAQARWRADVKVGAHKHERGEGWVLLKGEKRWVLLKIPRCDKYRNINWRLSLSNTNVLARQFVGHKWGGPSAILGLGDVAQSKPRRSQANRSNGPIGTILEFASVPLRKMGTDLLGSWWPCQCV